MATLLLHLYENITNRKMEAILNLQNRCSNLRVQLLQNLAQWIKKKLPGTGWKHLTGLKRRENLILLNLYLSLHVSILAAKLGLALG